MIQEPRRASVYAGSAAGGCIKAAGVHEAENPKNDGGKHQGSGENDGGRPSDTPASKSVLNVPEARSDDIYGGVHQVFMPSSAIAKTIRIPSGGQMMQAEIMPIQAKLNRNLSIRELSHALPLHSIRSCRAGPNGKR